jgi:hypothetical protein
MKLLKMAAVFVAASLFGCRTSRVAAPIETNRPDEQFVGSTPCDALAREFLRIPNDAPCERVQWQLKLHPSDVEERATYTLVITYGMQETNGPGFFQGGTRTEITGQWRTKVGNPDRTVYQLQATAPDRSLSLVKIDENLFHLLTQDGQLMVGNDSWSFTLNRMPTGMRRFARVAPLRLDATTVAKADGSKFLARFVGRTPCSEISDQIGASVPDQCFKIKWDVTLFQDETTGAAGTYRIDSTLYRGSPRLGRWKILNGTENHPNGVIYELESASGHGAIRLFQADDNIMFFVGQNGRLMVGNADFSYALNRADEKRVGK